MWVKMIVGGERVLNNGGKSGVEWGIRWGKC